ncbi:MAG: (2Fe-2S)-binding protein [Nocardioidaceae bacterium]|nr:(2Fe-2S)-binding protein [Nocardioidaceae bacterium]
MKIHVTINHETYDREVPEHRTLLEFLRDDIGATGTKEGCAAGECGACTVILDGVAVNACMVLAPEVDGATISTVEGEATVDGLSDLQAAFAKHHSVQCGFCTPGMLMSLRSLLDDNPKPSVEDIKGRIEGNFCRCTGYQQIIEAVLDLTGQLDHDHEGVLRHV